MIKRLVPVSSFFLIFLSSIAPITYANDQDLSSYDTIVWRGRPVSMHVQTGKEFLLRFPSSVQVGIPPDKVGMVKFETLSNQVYFTTLSDFTDTRIHFKRIDTGTIILLDFKSSSNGASVLWNVVDGVTADDPVSQQAEAAVRESESPHQTSYGMIELTRYAFQNVYSPKRLIDPLRGVSEYSIKSKEPLSDLVAGENVIAIPWGQWRSPDGLFITAVYLNNLSNHVVQLDPRRFRHSEDWKTASLYSGHLSPNNTLGDSTTLVVISENSWEDSISWLR